MSARWTWARSVPGIALCAGWTWIAIGGGGADVQVNQDPPGLVTNETSLTLNPMMPGNLVMAYNDQPYFGGPGPGISFSMDGGVTWTDRQLVYPAMMNTAFDPSITADSAGFLYAAFICTDNMAGGASGLFYWRSQDGGNTWWMTPSAADAGVGRLRDKPHIHVDDRPGSAWFDRLYFAYIIDAPPGPFSDIYGNVAWNNGMSIANPQQISDMPTGVGMGNGPNVTVAADGTVYVAWLDYPVTSGGQVPGTLLLDRSFDGGQTWGPDTFVRTILTLPNRLNGPGGPDVVARSYPCLESSPTNPLELYMVYAEDPDGPFIGEEADVFFIRSMNGGLTWSMPVTLNVLPGMSEFQPWIAVKPDGQIDVIWYEGWLTIPSMTWQLMMVRSVDGGATFGPPVPISDTPFLSPVDPWGQRWMGEYPALVVDPTFAYVGFTSSILDPLGDVYFDRVENVSVPAPCVGDLNGDRWVHQADLGILLSDWGCLSPPCPGDVDGDGDTDQSDLGLLLSRWGVTCP